MQYCKECLNVSTRPRITFNEDGVCSACQWARNKKESIDWKKRYKTLEELCNKYRCNDGSNWDVLVPCSGGKDGSYVAWKLKHEFGMHPLCVTLVPQLQTDLGRKNLENFQRSGFDHILITPNLQVYKKLAIRGFKEQGRPKLPFVTGVSTVTIKTAFKFNVPFVMYGEEGESEYGGVTSQSVAPKITRDYLVNYYYSGHDTTEYLDEFSKDDLKWWLLPTDEEMQDVDLFPTHWSHYENWNPYEHYLIAKKHCGLKTLTDRSVGTYTNFAQLDDYLQDLHAYIMFLKFGFGRVTSDVCIDIRRGALDRKQALTLIKRYDGEYPEELTPHFLKYFEMNREEFEGVLDKFANKDVLEKIEGKWRLKEDPH
ncbi:MAG: N-acetyl sugar amidotransferase [Candidatus Omnitrophica bacterium]|nr:N-acetyl sugar amidotransferase [Candidatus Omnitrophota bacterium]